MIDERDFFALPLDKREEKIFQEMPDAKLLKEKLLALGGKTIIWMPVDPDMENIIKNGREFPIENRRRFRGEPNKCHGNTARLFLQEDGIEIATGYALSKDERWRQHSWGWEKGRVVESTQPFTGYYGAVLKGLDISKFIFNALRDEVFRLPEKCIMKIPMPGSLEEME